MAGDEPSEEQLMAELDEFLAIIADPSLWDEPSPDLGDRVVAAVTEAAAASAPTAPVVDITSKRRSRLLSWAAPALAGAAAAAIVAVAVVNVGDDGGRSSADATIQLAGTDLLPDVSGTADVTALQSGLKIELDVSGLPRRDGDEFYEAWLRNEDGTGLIPIGTFHDGDDVTLWAGVALEDFPILTVTREVVAGPKDPGQGSSGEVVVRGQLQP